MKAGAAIIPEAIDVSKSEGAAAVPSSTCVTFPWQIAMQTGMQFWKCRTFVSQMLPVDFVNVLSPLDRILNNHR